MIQLDLRDLPQRVTAELKQRQAEIDALTDYATRVDIAKARWQNKPRTIFREIRSVLTDMCSGSQRCMYCEDSCADEVEHIQPKDFYPELVFVWDNYLYVCGPCNGGKNNAFAVFSADGHQIDIKRGQDDPIVPPAAGEPIFLNPRRDDPFAYLALDLLGTFAFIAMPGLNQRDRLRANYTCDTLKLNRDILVQARREAYGSYRARLREYVEDKRHAVPQIELDNMRIAIQRAQHPTVWREMKRQHARIKQLNVLFDQAPEALNW